MEAIAFLAFFGVFTLAILLALLVIALDNLIVPLQKPTLPDTTTIRLPPVDGPPANGYTQRQDSYTA